MPVRWQGWASYSLVGGCLWVRGPRNFWRAVDEGYVRRSRVDGLLDGLLDGRSYWPDELTDWF